LLIVTVVPPTVLAVVLVPLASTTRPPASAILITTPAAGCVFGKTASVAITSNPPIGAICAATKSTTAPEVGNFVSSSVMVVCFAMPSNWFRSAISEVRAVLSANLEAVPDCIPAKVFNSASAIFPVVTALSAILDVVT